MLFVKKNNHFVFILFAIELRLNGYYKMPYIVYLMRLFNQVQSMFRSLKKQFKNLYFENNNSFKKKMQSTMPLIREECF